MASDFSTPDTNDCECGDHVWRSISRGFVLLVSPEDAHHLRQGLHAHVVRRHAYGRLTVGGDLFHRVLSDVTRDLVVDHRDGNGLDNRKSNIRICTIAENVANKRKSRGVSRFKGVSMGCSRKWRSRIRVDRKIINLGSFSTEQEAAQAYDKAALSHFGSFARTNSSLGLL